MLVEDTKGVIIIREQKKGRERNGQKKKDKQRSTKHTHKTKDQEQEPHHFFASF